MEDPELNEAPWIGWQSVAVVWFLVGAVVFVLQGAASESPSLVDGLIQFDGPEYLAIVGEGYEQRQLVWFPMYPLAIWIVAAVLASSELAAVLVAAASGLAAALLFWRWSACGALSGLARTVGVLVLITYPYGWFLYGVVYPDALFLALALAAFLAMEKDKLGWSVVFGAMATAARPSGFAVAAGLWVLWLERRRILTPPEHRSDWVSQLRLPVVLHRERWSARALAPLLTLGGLVAFMAYQWVAWGSPLRFFTEQANYHEGGPSSLLKLQYFDAFYQGFDSRHLATTTAQAALLVVVLASVPAVGRRFGWGYGVYVLGLVLLPAVSVSTFMGIGRYLLPAFPCFALAGEWLAHKKVLRLVWIGASLLAMLVMAYGFGRSWYLT